MMQFKSFLIFATILLACSSTVFSQDPKIDPKQVKTLIDSISNCLNRQYIFPDKAKLIGDHLKKQYKSGAYSKISEPWQLGTKLSEDMAAIHPDKHMSIRFDPQMASDISKEVSDTEAEQIHKMLLDKEYANNFDFKKTEVLSDNIGYIRLDGFSLASKDAVPTLKAALEFVKNTRALIIDMRYNNGGNPDMVSKLLSHLFSEKTPINHIIDRGRDTLKRYADPALAEGLILKMPLYVLTSKNTFSAGEDFSYSIQVAKRGITVGETTKGGAHPTMSCNIGQGFVLHVPFARSVNVYTQTDWEGTGVIADIAVPAGEALVKAQTLIYEELIQKARDEQEKKTLQWNLYILKNKEAQRQQFIYQKIKIAPEDLAKFCGDYLPPPDVKAPLAPVSILAKDGYLYRHLNISGQEDVRLIPVSGTEFIYDDDTGRRLEFVLTNGIVSGITFTRQDGVFTLPKTK